VARANADSKDLLIKFTDTTAATSFVTSFVSNYTPMAQTGGAKIENLGVGNWVRVKLPNKQLHGLSVEDIRANPNVVAVQPNYKLRLLEDYRLKDPVARARFIKALNETNFPLPIGDDDDDNGQSQAKMDNPAFPTRASGGSGADPLFSKQWGMNDIGVKRSWGDTRGQGVTVAVIDTGVDYTHEDLVDNLWRNPGETGKDAQGRDKSSNGVDDDGNGFVDDVIGWDFVSNDNKPYDLSADPIEIILKGGNPGHGTHCAGNVAARADNGKGVAGVAPEAKIMAVRFIGEKGEGDTAGAIKAIDYAVKNGAKVLSNSWGGEGEDPNEAQQNQALRDAITAAQAKGVLFIAAAGNGHSGVGYDNDTDPKPSVPSTYPQDNIISVAAIDSSNNLGKFSNWGAKSVDIAAPGVQVYSTTVGGKYADTIIDLLGIKATWDGTSMACPHVAGAAALYWAKHPEATWQQVKAAILASAKPLPVLQGKVVSGGKLNVEALMAQ
jgi:subtilisin family serine protease